MPTEINERAKNWADKGMVCSLAEGRRLASIEQEQQKARVGKRRKVLPIPEGWEIVTSGMVQKGDRFAHLSNFVWSDVEPDDLELLVGHFDTVIRKK